MIDSSHSSGEESDEERVDVQEVGEGRRGERGGGREEGRYEGGNRGEG